MKYFEQDARGMALNGGWVRDAKKIAKQAIANGRLPAMQGNSSHVQPGEAHGMAFFRHRWLEICLYQCRRPSELFGGEAMMRAGWLVNILRFRPVLARAYNATIRRWLAHLFSAFAACFLIACGNDPPKPPASYPFPVFKKETTLNQQIQIVEHRAYVIELKFHSPDGKDIPKLRSLLTGGNYSVDKKYLGTGVPIPLKVAIFRLDNEKEIPVFEKVVVTQGAYSWSATEISRLVSYVTLKPGRHRLRLASVESRPEFSDSQVSLLIGIPPKTSAIKEK